MWQGLSPKETAHKPCYKQYCDFFIISFLKSSHPIAGAQDVRRRVHLKVYHFLKRIRPIDVHVFFNKTNSKTRTFITSFFILIHYFNYQSDIS